MSVHALRSRRTVGLGALILVVLVGLGVLLTQKSPAAAPGGSYLQTNIVSDVKGTAAVTDPKLINPWGIVAGPGTPFWIADNSTGVSTLYTGTGAPCPGAPASVAIPAPAGSAPDAAGTPTGTVFNGSSSFIVRQGAASGPSLFLFATEEGTIAGWSPVANPVSAIIAADNSAEGAVYKGLAIASDGSQPQLFAANFRENVIDVFDSSFQRVNKPGSFSDPRLPAGFAPFNVAALNGKLYVTYAKQNGEKHDDVAGAGNGYVDVYDLNGNLIRRLISGGALDSPWGLALAPAGFGTFGNDLLVGNFGDGKINAFEPTSGKFLGSLSDQHGKTLRIEGLWGLAFGSGPNTGDPNTLFFTAGIGGEKHGLVGSLQPMGASAGSAATGGAVTSGSGATKSTSGSSGYGY
ncbi:MAG: hypothetical protein QOH92_1433 [Chloroflexota bacterium]|jgi:uncharacterized protein (TIGR03118 family)|nr:hypothetical protein [Chloroflexota bacterium]